MKLRFNMHDHKAVAEAVTGQWLSFTVQGGNSGQGTMPVLVTCNTACRRQQNVVTPGPGNSSQPYLRSSHWSQSKTTAAKHVCEESYPSLQQ